MTSKANSSSHEVLVEFAKRYGPAAGEEGPVRLVREVFGVDLDSWQERGLRAYGRGERGISIRSCHGPGKTAFAAWCIWCNLLTRFPQKTQVTAPTSTQLENALVAEVKKWGNRLPPVLQQAFVFKAQRIELEGAEEESFFAAVTSRAEKPEALQGVHCDPGYVLLIADEASGVPEPVFKASRGSMSGHNCTTILISNPVRTTGFFYDTHHRLRDDWFTMKVSHEDSTRVSPQFVEDIRKQHGEDSNEFRIRCGGEFPTTDDEVLIGKGLVEGAQRREVKEAPNAPRVWGLDVARFGKDSTVLVERTARSAQVLHRWSKLNLMETVGRVYAIWQDTPDELRPRRICVDSVGMGGGVVDRLRELGLPAVDVNVGEGASSSDRFLNRRAELWWDAREWLETATVSLPDVDENTDPRDNPNAALAYELRVPTYKYTSNGKLQIESKDSIRARGHPSPDHADAFILTFAENVAAMVLGSRGGAGSWNEPVKRNLPVV